MGWPGSLWGCCIVEQVTWVVSLVHETEVPYDDAPFASCLIVDYAVGLKQDLK